MTNTSVAAFNAVKPKIPTLKQRVFEAIEASYNGITRHDVAKKLGLEENSVGPRLSELRKDGKIKVVPQVANRRNVYVIGEDTVYLASIREEKKSTNKWTVRQLADALLDDNTMKWIDTQEGEAFWSDIYDRLDRIASEGK